MCGRYLSPDSAAIEREFSLVRTVWRFPARFNVAPSQMVPAVRVNGRERVGSLLRWGLVPFFARGTPPTYSTINARMETVQTAASYRGPWKRAQRCLLPANGFYEWQLNADGKTKTPYYIHLIDQPIFAFAGLWDASRNDGGVETESCTHITMPANEFVGRIHNTKRRMPAILAQGDRDAWLFGSQAEAWEVLKPYPDAAMRGWPVSRRVNNPSNDDADIVAPIDPP